MINVKKILLFILLVTLGGFLFLKSGDIYTIVDRWLNFSFCDSSITYKIGTIDPKFELERERVVENAKKGGQLWNELVGRELFTYDQNSYLVIDLVFDERQGSLTIINEEKQNLDIKKDDLMLSVKQLEDRSQELEDKVNELNQEIRYWNQRGGAPKEIYDQLIDEQDEINNEIAKVNSMAQELNMETQKVNQRVDQVNQEVEKFNQLLSLKPEEGVYVAGTNAIEIYIYESDHNFTHTVAHELGHALGLGHVEEESSIMHPVSSPQSHATQSDLQLVSQFCAENNRLDLIRNDLENFIHIFLAQFSNVVT